jgi:hypothetical protein
MCLGGFFRDSATDAGLRGQPPNQIVHVLPRPQPVAPGRLLANFILSVRDLKFKRSAHVRTGRFLIRVASVAALQE